MRIGIYIGTCANDLFQYKHLINSIKAYNIDNIPVYTCVNDDDIEIFKTEFKDSDITFIKDSEVYSGIFTDGWWKQQIIKMNFWKLDLIDIMIQIDSDSFFVKNFYIKDFMATQEIPYTILHENKEIKELFARYNMYDSKISDNGDFRISIGYQETSDKIRKAINSPLLAEYDYGHPPCIWHNEVWKVLANMITENNLTYETLLGIAGSEQQWYGEILLLTGLFPIFPKENMFKTFHYKLDFDEYLVNNNLDDIKYNYHGICLQSNWSREKEEKDIVYSKFFTSEGNPKMYNGQYGEDVWLLNNLKNIPKKGLIVDVGADQPILGSNTYYFEKYLGWDCICIDADSRVIDNLKSKRKNVKFCAVSDYDGTVTFNQHELAGISAISEDGGVDVECKTLNTILEEFKVEEEITLLDIDVEGYELNVCRGLDWEKYKPKIVIIEFVSPSGGNIYQELINYFTELGNYTLVHVSNANQIYFHNHIINQ